MKFEKIFITVGTTEFNELIENIFNENVWKCLRDKIGCRKLKIQYGKGNKPEFIRKDGIKVEIYDLKQSIKNDILEADLIIGHAGAGTCIEVLNLNKPLIVVTNDTLMNQHQSELAHQLQNECYLECTPLSMLHNTLNNFDATKLKKYESGNINKFIEYLDDYMGFI
ncbi:hypothetical protein PVAND_001818 [Polypedilum vanderplanki]|uniref:UDP-N-acetylglucosamine transferase subunit ALG13 n=1 Tax=Polypedilum vanderplanki TaxID=319348 RepID=A0A9J6BP29_POLVA|nr:hypothetical protein PVAND_001818 [Polypedilum vanderplanki]